jgi:multidrug efflux pump subunit AcrB
MLKGLLQFRWAVLAATIVVLIFGGVAASFLVREFFGAGDRNQFLVYLDLPAGYNIKATDRVAQRLGSWLTDKKKNPEISSSIAYVGTGGPRFFLSLSPFDPDPNRAFVVVNTQNGQQVPELVERVRTYFLAAVPEGVGRAKAMWMGATEPGLIQIRLIGPDADILHRKGHQLLAELNSMPGILDVRSDWENKVLKSVLEVDQARARRAQVTSSDVANTLQAHLDGIQVTEYREGDVAIPVILRSADEERNSLGDLSNVNIYSPLSGVSAPAAQIIKGKPTWEFSRISRRNQERTLTVDLKHKTLRAPELLEAVQPLIDGLKLNEGYRIEIGGEIEKSVEANEKLTRYLPPCLIGIIILLIWQFNSFRRPAIILATLPLAFCGAFFGVALVRAPFDFFGILGLLSLAGVIINNGIVLIDRIESERTDGREPYDAVVESAVSRFRPILMTTITTILGVMPLIVWRDPLFFTLAIIIAFGLAFGTVLTLGVVPVLYSLLFRIRSPHAA